MALKARRAALAAAVALVGAVAWAGPGAAQPFRLIISDLETPLVPNSVMDLAERLGYFDKEGVDVELVRVQQTPSVIAALRAGEGDMGNVSVDAVLQLVARDQMKLKAVISPNKSLPYLIAAKEGIASVADLQGKNYGIGRIGSLDHTLTVKVLNAQDVKVDQVNFVGIGQPAVRAQALAGGQIDATTVSIGVWMSLPDKDGLKVLLDQDAYYEAAPVVNKVNVVTEEVLASKRDQIAAVIRAITKASRDFAADPKLWVDAMAAARPDVDRADLELLAEAFKGSWSVNGGLNREELEYTVNSTYESEDFKDLRRVETPEWVDFTVVDEVLKGLGPAPEMDQPVR